MASQVWKSTQPSPTAGPLIVFPAKEQPAPCLTRGHPVLDTGQEPSAGPHDGLATRRCEPNYLSKAAPRPPAGHTYEPATRRAEGATATENKQMTISQGDFVK